MCVSYMGRGDDMAKRDGISEPVKVPNSTSISEYTREIERDPEKKHAIESERKKWYAREQKTPAGSAQYRRLRVVDKDARRKAAQRIDKDHKAMIICVFGCSIIIAITVLWTLLKWVAQ